MISRKAMADSGLGVPEVAAPLQARPPRLGVQGSPGPIPPSEGQRECPAPEQIPTQIKRSA